MKMDAGSSRTSCSLATLRLLLLVGMVIMAVVIVTWSIGDHIRICTSDTHVHVQGPTSRPSWEYNWDRRGQQVNTSDIPSRIIILIRHGKYDLATGHLNEQGKQQADLTGKRLAEMNWPWDFLHYSPLDRAVETADIIHKHISQVPKMVDYDIREGGPVPPKPTITYWGLPGTTYHEDGPRLEGAFRKIFHRPERGKQTHRTHEIYVGHGNIFRFFTLRALQLPPEAWMRVFIPHGSMTILHIQGNGIVHLDHFGDAGFMPHNLISY